MRAWSLCLGCGSYFLPRHLHPLHSERNNSRYSLEDVMERTTRKGKTRWDIFWWDAHRLEDHAICCVTPVSKNIPVAVLFPSAGWSVTPHPEHRWQPAADKVWRLKLAKLREKRLSANPLKYSKTPKHVNFAHTFYWASVGFSSLKKLLN